MVRKAELAWYEDQFSYCLLCSTTEHSRLEVIYASTMNYLEEGETVNLNCLIRHQQNQSSQTEAHWYKKLKKQNEAGFGKDMEGLHHSWNLNLNSYVLSASENSEFQPDSGHCQCRAQIKNTVLTAMGLFIRVNVTGKLHVSGSFLAKEVVRSRPCLWSEVSACWKQFMEMYPLLLGCETENVCCHAVTCGVSFILLCLFICAC